MNRDLENRLREALQPVEPPQGFADRVLAQVHAQPRPIATARAHRRRFRLWLPAALAATVVASLLGVHFWQQKTEQEAGLQARQQLIEALRVTSEKLDLAYQAVNTPEPQGTEASGA